MTWREVVAAVVAAIAAVLDTLIAFLAGRSMQQVKDMEREIQAIERANKAAADNRALPIDERLRDARERGLYRVPGQSSDDK